MSKVLPKNVEIIGTHPMFGPDSAKYGLKGLQVIVCPVRSSEQSRKYITAVFKDLELEVIKTTAQKHDRESARSLALVHFLGRGLTDINVKKQAISSLGYERLLTVNETVTNDSWQLFQDMHQYNPYAKKLRQDYIKALKDLDKDLK